MANDDKKLESPATSKPAGAPPGVPAPAKTAKAAEPDPDADAPAKADKPFVPPWRVGRG